MAEPDPSADRASSAAPTSAPQRPQPLLVRARRALGWSLVNILVGRVGTTLMGIVLARILVPQDYGVYAVALVVLNAMLSMNELGVSVAIVRWPGDVGRIAPTVATLAVASSTVLYLAGFLAAPTICRLMHVPSAGAVLRVLTLGVLIDAVTSVPAAMMTREFQQGRRLVVDTLGFLVISSTSIALALAGAGAWSLVVGAILGNVVNGVLVLAWAPARLRFGFRPDVARELLAFGLPLAAASLLIFGTLNIDYVVVGRMLGQVPLGLYLLAFNLSSFPVSLFSAPVRRVSLPAFARLAQEPGRAGGAFVRAAVLLMAVTVPACLLLAVFADPLLAFVYGHKWQASAGPLPWLAGLALARVFGELSYDFLVALGRSRANLVIQLLWFVGLVPALTLGARFGGVTGVAVGHAVVAAFVAAPALGVVLHRAGVPVLALLGGLRRPAAGLVVAAAVGVAVRLWVPGAFWQLAIGGIAAAGGYAALVAPLRGEVRSLLRREPATAVPEAV